MKMKDADAEAIRTARNAALKMKDPLGSQPVKTDFFSDDATLGEVLQDIVEYIEHCFDFSDNPLPHLREYFPDFDWAFYKPEKAEEVARIGEEADYILPVDPYGASWSCGFFTATRRYVEKKKKIYFCPTVDMNEPDLNIWPYDEIAKVGALVLVNDPSNRIDGKSDLVLISCAKASELVEQKIKSLLQS